MKLSPKCSEYCNTHFKTKLLRNFFCDVSVQDFNPFEANVLFLYSLKTSESQIFSDTFRGRGDRSAILTQNGLKASQNLQFSRLVLIFHWLYIVLFDCFLFLFLGENKYIKENSIACYEFKLLQNNW